ncbi:MAG: hypothetical protein ABSC54_03230 [Smithellaceae bacterium]|jgi:hypothetical protein
MKRIFPLILTTVFFASCQSLPVINVPAPPADGKISACPSPFLKERYRLIHAIEIRMAGDTQGAIIGVTLADPATHLISCAIMMAEGVVLFEAEEDAGLLKVNRALPPFDSADFAQNMIDDIKLIFFAPTGKIEQQGRLPGGAVICRWREKNGGWIDVLSNQPNNIEIKKYSSCGSLKRHVKFEKTDENIYQNIELQANEIYSYSLFMTLIEAQPAKKELLINKAHGKKK